jgi:RNA polymerase sigma-70 factor (ECF subfamily)
MTMSEQRLEQALPSARSGEAWALRAVYEELAPKVLGYLTSRGAREPEDLTSEVFVTVFPRLSSLTGGVPGLRTFTFSVAHARLVDDLRQRSRREPDREYVPEHDPRSYASAEDHILEQVGTQRVQELLAKLPDGQRDVIALRIVADLTVEQVATALRTTPGAVKQLQRRGLDQLRQILMKEGHDA